MIKVLIGNNLDRDTVIFNPDTTLREALESRNIDYSTGMATLDGATLKPGELNKTFADFGYDGSDGRDRCSLICVVKADNA